MKTARTASAESRCSRRSRARGGRGIPPPLTSTVPRAGKGCCRRGVDDIDRPDQQFVVLGVLLITQIDALHSPGKAGSVEREGTDEASVDGTDRVQRRRSRSVISASGSSSSPHMLATATIWATVATPFPGGYFRTVVRNGRRREGNDVHGGDLCTQRGVEEQSGRPF